jgi:8-hydroxy-5-deazaflavin:NADPH oxidoreductase
VKVTIVGAGNMGRGIATRVVAGGNEVELIDQNPDDAESLAKDLGEAATAVDKISGEIVVLALPYEAIAPAVEQYGDELAGKVVVDIANPVEWSTMDRVVTPEDSSSAEETAKLVPKDASVVKAFNTTFAGTLVAGTVGGQPIDVFIAADDADAKRSVSRLVEDGGMRAVDAGPLARAHELEALGYLHMTLQEPLGTGFGSAVKIVA